MEAVKLLVTNIRDDDFEQLERICRSTKHELKRIPIERLSVELLRKTDFHVYLTDLREGGKHAIDFIRKSKDEDIVKPIIALTHKAENDFDLTLKVGASAYLVMEDLTPEIINYTIQEAIDKNRLIEQLHDEAQNYRMLFKASIDAIYMIDADKQFTDANPAMLTLLGYNKEEILQMQLRDIFESQARKEVFKTNMAEQEFVKDFETKLLKKNGELLDCIINSVCHKDLRNEITGYQGIIHDITIMKNAQKEIVKNEKLAITGKMSRSIAHEVRNPLTNINLAMEQMVEEFDDKDLEFYTNIISRSTKRIDNLVNQLMKTTKPAQLVLREYPVTKLLDECLQLVSDRIKLQGVKVIKAYNVESLRITVDTEKIRTALLNLLINALEAMSEDHGVLILQCDLKADNCIITVEDNGPGIEKHVIDELFDPFYTGKDGGMGLGLTSTRNIIKSHQGDIDVESELGKGTKFMVRLNLKPRNIERKASV